MSSSVASQGCFMLHLSVTISHEQSGAVGCFGNNSCYCNTPTCLKPSDVTLSATKLVRGCSPGHVLHTRLASPPTPQSPTLLFSPNKGEYTNLLQEERRRKRWGGLETSCHFQPITQAPTLQLDFAAPVSCPTAKGCAVETKT